MSEPPRKAPNSAYTHTINTFVAFRWVHYCIFSICSKTKDMQSRELRLAVERNIRHWGTASVDLTILEFPKNPLKDEERISKLSEVFTKDLRGSNPVYWIPAKIDSVSLNNALELSGLTLDVLKSGPDPKTGFPHLTFPAGYRLTCLQGAHRAAAAARVLPPEEKRWPVDLFDAGRYAQPDGPLRFVVLNDL